MWNDLSQGFLVLPDAFSLLSRSWGFWLCAGSMAGLGAVYLWRRRRLALWAFFLAVLFLMSIVGLACYKMGHRNMFLWVQKPDSRSVSGVYEVESMPRERWFYRPQELTRFFQISSSSINLHEDGTCEVSSFPRPEAWGWWINHPESRADLSVLEEDLVSTYRGTWSLVNDGGYYGVSIVCSPGSSFILYLGGENAECLVMPVNPYDPLEAVTFEKVR